MPSTELKVQIIGTKHNNDPFSAPLLLDNVIGNVILNRDTRYGHLYQIMIDCSDVDHSAIEKYGCSDGLHRIELRPKYLRKVFEKGEYLQLDDLGGELAQIKESVVAWPGEVECVPQFLNIRVSIIDKEGNEKREEIISSHRIKKREHEIENLLTNL